MDGLPSASTTPLALCSASLQRLIMSWRRQRHLFDADTMAGHYSTLESVDFNEISTNCDRGERNVPESLSRQSNELMDDPRLRRPPWFARLKLHVYATARAFDGPRSARQWCLGDLHYAVQTPAPLSDSSTAGSLWSVPLRFQQDELHCMCTGRSDWTPRHPRLRADRPNQTANWPRRALVGPTTTRTRSLLYCGT